MHAFSQTASADPHGCPVDVADGAAKLNVQTRRLGQADLLARVNAAVSDEKKRRSRRERGIHADIAGQKLDPHDGRGDRRVGRGRDHADETEGREGGDGKVKDA